MALLLLTNYLRILLFGLQNLKYNLYLKYSEIQFTNETLSTAFIDAYIKSIVINGSAHSIESFGIFSTFNLMLF